MIVTAQISLDTPGDTSLHDITSQVEQIIRDSGVHSGIVTLFIPGSTAGLTTIEYEPGLLNDVPRFFEHIAPRGQHYDHDATWQDGNGHSHIRASLLGPSLVVPFMDGTMCLGQWQQIVLVEFDVRPRRRKIVVQVMGEHKRRSTGGSRP